MLLLGVSVGMIVHSLKYKSQTVSGLAYFIAFATLALGENTPFAVLALIPLAGSMLVIAHRFDWTRMAVFGVVATYATCASRPDAGAPLGSTQALFAAYWLLFEAFDLLRVREARGRDERRIADHAAECSGIFGAVDREVASDGGASFVGGPGGGRGGLFR